VSGGLAPIKILLADDHTLVRAGIRRLVENLPGVEVVGEASDGLEALAMAAARTPDMVLLDIGMPGLSGFEVAQKLSALIPSPRVVILSVHDSEEYVVKALRAGCAGYLLKDSAVSELEVAVRAVARGESYLSPPISKQVVADYLRRTGSSVSSPLEMLTLRQREILQLVAEGHTSKDIAQKLGLSFKTVENHRAHIMERLGVHDLTGLVRFAVRAGLVSP
jgi:DNA-binding NarL/FixJ family response regulator